MHEWTLKQHCQVTFKQSLNVFCALYKGRRTRGVTNIQLRSLRLRSTIAVKCENIYSWTWIRIPHANFPDLLTLVSSSELAATACHGNGNDEFGCCIVSWKCRDCRNGSGNEHHWNLLCCACFVDMQACIYENVSRIVANFARMEFQKMENCYGKDLLYSYCLDVFIHITVGTNI